MMECRELVGGEWWIQRSGHPAADCGVGGPVRILLFHRRQLRGSIALSIACKFRSTQAV